MKPKNFRDPNELKLCCLMMRKERKSRKKEFLKLKYSDIGKLLYLIRVLHDSSCTPLRIAINMYLQKVTNADITFIVEEWNRVPEAVVKAIGTKELKTEIRFQVDNDFMVRLRKSEEPREFKECFIDPLFLECIKDSLKSGHQKDFCNCLMIPIYHPYTKKVVLYCGLINYSSNTKPIEYYHTLIGECFRYCLGIVLNGIRYDEEHYFHRKYKEILNHSINLLECLDNIHLLIEKMRDAVCSLFDGERCRIYLKEGNKLVSRIEDYGQAYDTSNEIVNNVKIPLGVGLQGKVAETGEIINCTNPAENELYRNDLDIAIRHHSRNILVFPILLYEGVFGVVQVLNKVSSNQFGSADMQFARFVGPIFGVLLHICLEKKKLWDAMARRAMMEELFLRGSKVTDSGEANEVLLCTEEHDFPNFMTYKYIPLDISPTDSICKCFRLFKEYGLLHKFSIEERSFVKFLIKIRNRHSDLPLHNWLHSYSTFHFLHVLIKKERVIETQRITYIQLLAMLIATLCHSMEFKERTTKYQPTVGTTLGSLYSSPGSILQIYSIAQVVRLMASRDCPILHSMDVDTYKEFIKHLDIMILYTDLSEFVSRRTAISEMVAKYDMSNPEHPGLLHCLLLTCSGLNEYCKQFQYCNKFVDAIMEEFFNSDLNECVGPIDVTGFKDNIDLKKVDLQIHFMAVICEPAFKYLESLFPSTGVILREVEENAHLFKTKKDEVVQKQMEF